MGKKPGKPQKMKKKKWKKLVKNRGKTEKFGKKSKEIFFLNRKNWKN